MAKVKLVVGVKKQEEIFDYRNSFLEFKIWFGTVKVKSLLFKFSDGDGGFFENFRNFLMKWVNVVEIFVVTLEDIRFELGLENAEEGFVFDYETFENGNEKIPFFFFDIDLYIFLQKEKKNNNYQKHYFLQC